MTSLSDLPLRADLVGKLPYGAPQDPVPVSLNVNENTHPIPDAVVAEIVRELEAAVRSANRYPDREFLELRAALADYLGHGLSAEQLWAANGSNEVLQQVLQAFGGPGRSLLSFTPSYSMYPILAAGTGTEWVAVPRPADFELSADAVTAALREHRPEIAVICAPNNPTGTPVGLDVIAAAYDACPGILIVDEAYAEFGDAGESAVSLLPGRPRLLVSRTMSKAFAFAGVRLGYLAADAAVIDALRLVRLPYHLSGLTQAAGRAALRHADTMLGAVGAIREQRDRLAAALAGLGHRVYRSGSNFLLADGFGEQQETFAALRERGILIRDVGIPGHLRFTAGTAAETTILIEALTELSAQAQGASA